MKKIAIKPLITFVIGWPLSLLAIYFILERIISQKNVILSNIAHVNLFLLVIGTLCFIGYYYLRSIIWYLLLRSLKNSLPFKESTSLWAITQLKRYIPGNIWSFVGLTVLLEKKGIQRKHILQAIFFEQQLVVIAAPLVSFLAFPYLFNHIISRHLSIVVYPILILFAGIMALYIWNKKIRFSDKIPARQFLQHILPDFHEKTNGLLIVLMAGAFFLFGAGYYFVITAVVFITPALFFQIIGLSVFSLLVGFVSFITPTGLGIREGVLTFGLAKIIPFSLAGFAALFARIVLIVAELLFVAIAYLWDKAKHTRVVAFEKFIQSNVAIIVVTLLVVMYTVYFSGASFLRYENFFTGKFDLGNMSQTVWNTAQGNIFQMTDTNSTRVTSRLGYHADFFLVLLAPFYFLWESPKVLLLIQSIILGCGAYFAFLLAKEILKNNTVAILFAGIYILNPSIQWVNLYDFHAVALATPFLLGAFYFMLTKKYWWFLLFCVLAGFTKEEVWFVIALFGVYLFFVQKKRLLGSVIGITSLGLFYVLLWHAIPNASGSSSHFALSYYEDGGDSPSALIKHTLLSPGKTLQTLVSHDKLVFIKQLFMPLGFLSFIGFPYLLFAASDFGINLLSSKPELHQIYYQYTSVITPFLFIAALYGITITRRFFPKIPLIGIASYLVIMTVISAYYFGPLPGSKMQNIDMFTRPQENRAYIMHMLRSIPQEKSVTATNNLGAHLSHRTKLNVVPLGIGSADYAVFLFTSSTYYQENPEYQALQQVKKDKRYKEISEKGLFFIFKKV